MSKKSQEQALIGCAWFDREQWECLTQVVPDRNELDDTFEQWEENAVAALRQVERAGHRAERVPINVEELLSWCKTNGSAPDGKGRAAFVSSLLQKKYGTKS